MKKISSIPTVELFALVVVVLQVGILGVYFLNTNNGFDSAGHLVGRDFANIYLGGKLIGQGQAELLFSPDQYLGAMRDWLGPDYPIHNWSYPPIMFWPAEQLSKLPYFIAYLVWTIGGVALLGIAIRQVGLGWLWVLCIVLSPAGMWNIIAGQNAYYIAALLIFAIKASQTNHRLKAGFFWTLATIKPHLGLLAIPMLIGQRRFGVIALGALIFSIVSGGVILQYGVDSWLDFFEVTAGQQRIVLEFWSGSLLGMMPTAFMQGRLLGLSASLAYALHGFVFLITVWLLARAWIGKNADFRYWLTWFALGTYLLLPYSFVYDFILLHVVLALWNKDPGALFQMQNENSARNVWIVVWFLPLVLVSIAIFARIQVMPFVLLWLLWRLGSRPTGGVDSRF